MSITYVPEYLKKMLPYTPGQTIRFSNAGGGIFTASVEKESYNSSGWEVIKVKLKVGLHSFVDFSIDNRPIVFLGVMSPLDNYQVGGGFDFEVVQGVSQASCVTANGRQTCIGTVSFQGKTYSDVLLIQNGSIPPTSPDRIWKAYYNTTKGLIAFEYGSGIIYSLHD